ncbi:E3 ubiquitin-protein ligase TRIM39-like isoform X2 [Hemicordylus capensis]|uniref:E3 ubiquitin-protein ligase TRIM39-like isoform X2 n=1 Tax=Hemicordylus capensis TaxID=884348 RepID=UPI0023023D45|nr:E3 ubiquitin-protein ligase TRIM39-like isoform X2 [Hemicordylus capensis]
MAALSLGMKQLQDEATCSVCLDFFTDPVTLDCGHNFCQACIAQCWGEPPSDSTCPQCRERVQPRNLKPNRQFANMVALAKEFSVQQVGGWRVCGRHQEPLKLFCQDDEAPLCVVCHLSKEHRAHTVVPAQEAAQEYKNQIVAERQKAVAQFRELHQFLEEQETLLLTRIEDMEKEIAGRRDGHMITLSEELSSLDKIIQETEEKCEQTASELLQDVRSALQRCKEKERSEYLVAFPLSVKQRVWDMGDRNIFLENAMKQFKDYLSGSQLQQANVTLDPATAHHQLILAKDRRSVRWGERRQYLPSSLERFSFYCFVLGCEGFTAGRHCWEVTVGSGGNWAVGVARKSVKGEDKLSWGPKGGIWAVRHFCGSYEAPDSPSDIYLSLTQKPERIKVTLKYAVGQVAFSDADSAAPIYTFSEASFSGETLFPFFWLGEGACLTLSC